MACGHLQGPYACRELRAPASLSLARSVCMDPNPAQYLIQRGYKRYTYYTMLAFEYHEPKSQANFAEYGIDFVEAQRLWNDPDLLEIPAKTEDEARFLIIGQIDEVHWSAVITYRRAHIRIISVRRSRTEEVALYESQDI